MSCVDNTCRLTEQLRQFECAVKFGVKAHAMVQLVELRGNLQATNAWGPTVGFLDPIHLQRA